MNHKAIQRIIEIKADAQGNRVAPDRIHLMTAGHWHTPWHGAFEMTPSDLMEMVANFGGGVGLVEGSVKAPINYGHDQGGKAAGWIVSLSVENNGTELWGDIEWTPEGRRALEEGEYRYISPEWNPRDLPWENPESEGEIVANVFTGAGLTNIPLFKKLKPIMASIATGGSDSNNEGGDMLVLDEVRVKTPEELTDEEKAFLEEHKADLTDEERSTFGLEEGSGDGDAEGDTEDGSEEEGGDDAGEEGDGGDAAEGDGDGGLKGSAENHGISADELAQLRADAKAGREAQQELLKVKLTASVKEHVDRGAIKSDQADEAVAILMASTDAQRDRLQKFIASLPSNELITKGEIGDGGNADATAQDELMRRARDEVKASDGKTTLNAAVKAILAGDSDLRERVNAERVN